MRPGDHFVDKYGRLMRVDRLSHNTWYCSEVSPPFSLPVPANELPSLTDPELVVVDLRERFWGYVMSGATAYMVGFATFQLLKWLSNLG